MIKNIESIITQNMQTIECKIKEFVYSVQELEKENKLTVNSIEKLAGETILMLINIVLAMAGALLSNIVTEKTQAYCECGRKMILSKRNALTRILTVYGYINVTRDIVFLQTLS